MKGDKASTKSTKSTTTQLLKSNNLGAAYNKLSTDIKGKVSTRLNTKSKTYSAKKQKQEEQKKTLDESIQKKKGFWGRFKNIITFKKANSYMLIKNIKSTEKNLETVENARTSIATINAETKEAQKAVQSAHSKALEDTRQATTMELLKQLTSGVAKN